MNPHQDCRQCIEGVCHAGCALSLGPKNSPSRVKFDALLAAADRADVAALVGAAKGIDGFVFYNSSRDAVQVLGCDKRAVIESLPVLSSKDRVASVTLPCFGELSGGRGGPMRSSVSGEPQHIDAEPQNYPKQR